MWLGKWLGTWYKGCEYAFLSSTTYIKSIDVKSYFVVWICLLNLAHFRLLLAFLFIVMMDLVVLCFGKEKYCQHHQSMLCDRLIWGIPTTMESLWKPISSCLAFDPLYQARLQLDWEAWRLESWTCTWCCRLDCLKSGGAGKDQRWRWDRFNWHCWETFLYLFWTMYWKTFLMRCA